MSALLERRLVVVTGKGGVGKSTVAAALGVAAARRGLRAIVAEVAGRRDVARLLGEGDGPDHLTITPREAMEEYLRDQLPRPVAELLAHSGTFAAFVEATPGMAELLQVGKAWELAGEVRRTPGERPYDLVVLDAPASGHGLALLGAPRTFSDAARVGPIHRQAGLIDATLTDPARTAVVVVTTPEEMPVNETLELRDALRDRLGIEVALVVANAVAPDRFTAEEARTLAATAGPAERAALWAHERARGQRAQLRRLRAGLDAAPVKLPLVVAAELDRAAIDGVADGLGRAL